MRLAHRIDQLPPYLFYEISKRITEKRSQGVDVISLAIGDPDLPTPDHILQSLHEASLDPANHRYPESDSLPELRKAVAEWYERRFNLSFDPNKEVLPLIGSKEGIAHIALCLIDPGDIALVPDPGYPVYSTGTMFAGGTSHFLPCTEETDFLPDLDAIPPDVAQRAQVLWINYPNNPTGATAELDFYERVVHFAKKYDVAVCHDAPYTEVAYDGYRPSSFLEAPGARDVGVEFHSFSKTYNMTGWRIGMIVGNPTMVNALLRVKSNIDSGIPQAIQRMAISAVYGSQENIPLRNSLYQQRRDRIVATLQKLGFRVRSPKAAFYVWAKLPEGFTSSIDFCARMLDDIAVVCTPGIGYGQYGEGYIRITITTPDDRLDEALRRLESWSPAPAEM